MKDNTEVVKILIEVYEKLKNTTVLDFVKNKNYILEIGITDFNQKVKDYIKVRRIKKVKVFEAVLIHVNSLKETFQVIISKNKVIVFLILN